MDRGEPNLAVEAPSPGREPNPDADILTGSGGGARRPPTTLFNRAARVLADHVLPALTAAKPAEAKDSHEAEVRDFVSSLPPNLADTLTSTLVSRFVDLHGQDDADDADPLVLLGALGGSVTDVDLSPLVWLGQRRPSELTAFGARLAAVLPRLAQLSRLGLGTHGQRYSLPACSDATLHGVARSCAGLRHLDLSRNTAISAEGLASLCAGCPQLEELLLFGCALPTAVLAAVLRGLPRLRVLGHQEAGAAVLQLWRDEGGDLAGGGDALPAPLRLTQVANLGEAAAHRSKAADEPSRLRCRAALVHALRTLCPDLEELRVRVLDEDAVRLGALPRLRTLELRFHAAAKPSSLGARTLRLVRGHGARLHALTVYSHSLRERDFRVLGRHCPQLRQLWMRANYLVLDADGPAAAAEDDDDALPPPGAPPPFARLENLSVRVGWDERSECRLPAAFVQGLVRHAAALAKLYVAANSADVTDDWLRAVLGAMDCAALRTLFLLLPARNEAPPQAPASAAWPRLALTPESVRLVRAKCPDLEELGNLLVWSFQQEEVRHLQQQLRASNSRLRLVAKKTVWR